MKVGVEERMGNEIEEEEKLSKPCQQLTALRVQHQVKNYLDTTSAQKFKKILKRIF